MRFPRIPLVVVGLMLLVLPLGAQSPNGTINGLVLDPSNRVIAGAEIIAVNDVTNLQFTTKTSNEGVYVLPNLSPGPYRLQVSKAGFKTIIKPDITLNVQDALSINFTLPIGALMETVTVEGGTPLVNTETAAVSTVVDRQFTENLPMNGRSFQALIDLTPGVVVTPSSPQDSGQFSVNGQRTASNYWTVDGVSANIGIGSFGNNGVSGALGGFSAQGGTNSLVSIDAMQEFRIQTSSYAPEFGRVPGGQISIVTRSGTNQFHGTAFDYFRNDVLDASNWFNGYTNDPPLSKAKERQNDFGGTIGGPILKQRTFFFFSYEGLRLRLPQTGNTTVPDLSARQAASPALQPYLNAFPLDPRQRDLGNGKAQFSATYSIPSSLDAYSLRVDHRLNNKATLFARYNDSPSSVLTRGAIALSVVSPSRVSTRTATVGGTWTPQPAMTNDLRVNYSHVSSESYSYMDTFGGAVPLPHPPFPGGYSPDNASFSFNIESLTQGDIAEGKLQSSIQRQVNLVDSFSWQVGSHVLKFGIDLRRLTPVLGVRSYSQGVTFLNVSSAETGNLFFSDLISARPGTILLRNLGVFAQDTWHAGPRLTLTYGLRWDVDFAPRTTSGPALIAVTGFELNDLSHLSVAPPGTPAFRTPYKNVAPRVGAAYQVVQNEKWRSVFRGGFGIFYDLATQELGNNINDAQYPFGTSTFSLGGTFPLNTIKAKPPAITIPGGGSGVLDAFDPHLNLPYTLEWNVAFEQGLGLQQKLSLTYVGSAGRRLIQSTTLEPSPNPNFGELAFVTNAAKSNYQAMQIQLQRRLSAGLQFLASYSWAHSIDTASAGSAFGNIANDLVPGTSPSFNRGPSDFDIRNTLSAGMTYTVPARNSGTWGKVLCRDWSVENLILIRSALPVDVSDQNFSEINGAFADVRPDLVPSIPIYLFGGQYPGGKAFNPVAFVDPPIDPKTETPLRQGDLSRNALRGFGVIEWDSAVHRSFPIHDGVRLEFRAEMFNVINHPNLGPPSGLFGLGGFGISNQTLGQYLAGGNSSNVGGGAFSPLYQIGGPRSIQLALKLMF